ncbi:MAG: sn-glycerol-3-phosphate ABC transporter ATP-binding protein UgpC [Ignavibacteriales bacterium]|nr:sn-glycerol-3-phosphate ABC transporter ATP-binding protein UgpC [Ignavibacteriales bacterium]
MAEIIFKNVCKSYDGKTKVVDDFSLTIGDKEFVVFVGPSGCGKSTTLRMIAGLEEINGGEIFIDGKLVNDVPPKDRDIAMVFQNYALYPHMSVFENLAFGLKLRKFEKEEIRRRVNEAAAILGIEGMLGRKPKELSGGQKQRVALGRAIVRNPKVFLFDEPLSNLDAKLRVQMRTEISKLHKNLNTTMIYVTHDQVEAMTMADRIVLMKDGIIQQVDTPMSIYRNPVNKFVAGFIGSPAMNFIEGKLIEKNIFVSNDEKIKIELKNKIDTSVDKNIMLGIRPEDIKITSAQKSDGDLTANVELFEPLGSEALIHFVIGNNKLVGRSFSSENFKYNQTVNIFLEMDKIHLFNSTNGKTLSQNK